MPEASALREQRFTYASSVFAAVVIRCSVRFFQVAFGSLVMTGGNPVPWQLVALQPPEPLVLKMGMI